MSAAIPIASSSKVTQDYMSATATPRSMLVSSPRTYVPHGSYGQRFSLGVSPGYAGDASFKPMLGSSIGDEHDALIKTLSGANVNLLSEDMCRNYTCCGLALNDLHALVEHFEEAHVVVVDPNACGPAAAFSAGGFALPDDMELDEPTPSPTSSFSAFDNTSVLVRRSSSAFGAPAFSPYPPREALRRMQSYSTDPAECAPPELLFSPSATPSPAPSRDASPEPHITTIRRPSSLSGASDSAAEASSDMPSSRPKPFRCPKPGCNKSYKQANGLKYHVTHGQCNFAPKDPNSDDLKPYSCQGGCNKRFKNMSGLRYHYQHSEECGKTGLATLPGQNGANSSSSSAAAAVASAQS
ncbi:hypothetical protein EXIGLDRAFT_701137 [Exidia glandulosa HHB12029]|uniref:C2H2-type domain-containing protein n=1 Tax=Exidia glandulosa HHB12029 TaxID=1314781 RepID=A0A165ZL90_EXIGL|nr:hypothetical protein EXIGLDRAFT_701137 [Exidia glandulosa HHB12029]